MERRFCDRRLELRAAEGESARPVIRGYGVVFNSPTVYGDYLEMVAPDAFDDVDMSDVRILFNHDPNYILGRTASKTARVGIDEQGVWYEVDPPKWADGLVETISRGDVTQSSFGFAVATDRIQEMEDGRKLRVITKISRLFDLSPVTYPAYQDTEAVVRSLQERMEQEVSAGATAGEGNIAATRERCRRRLRLLEIN